MDVQRGSGAAWPEMLDHRDTARGRIGARFDRGEEAEEPERFAIIAAKGDRRYRSAGRGAHEETAFNRSRITMLRDVEAERTPRRKSTLLTTRRALLLICAKPAARVT
jgi:hypothetical protein